MSLSCEKFIETIVRYRKHCHLGAMAPGPLDLPVVTGCLGLEPRLESLFSVCRRYVLLSNLHAWNNHPCNACTVVSERVSSGHLGVFWELFRT